MKTKTKKVSLKKSPPKKENALEKRLSRKKGITSWSFSRYSDYKQCPLKAKYKHVDRIKEPGNEAMDRGSAIGKMAELYIRGKKKKLAPELSKFKDLFKELAAQFKKKPGSMVVEDTWAFRKDWSPTKWDDWAGCHLRVKMDCGRLLSATKMDLIDFKTGKYRPEQNDDYMEQLELYALSALVLNPQIEEVVPRLVYLDLGIIHPEPGGPDHVVYTRKDVPKLKSLWDKRTRKMLLDRSFAPKPNSKCHWCWYGQSKKSEGGPGLCKF